MKYLRILLSTLMIITLFSCNDKNVKTEVEAVAPEKNESGFELNETGENVLTVENPKLDMSQEKAEMMYEDLNMTKDQIYSFETQFKERVKDAEKLNSNPNEQIDKDQIRHDALKEILSKEQLDKYEVWIKVNN